MLKRAQEGGYAIPCFICWDLTSLNAVIDAAEKERSPIILGVPDKERWKHASYDLYVKAARIAAEEAGVPVVLHLDHGTSLSSIIYAIQNGMTSVMIDGSALPLEENIRLTKRVVEIAHSVNIPVEGELGRTSRDAPLKTKPEEVAVFVDKTKVDSLSVSIGNVSGTPEGKAKLDFNLLRQIRNSAKIPLVLHGGT